MKEPAGGLSGKRNVSNGETSKCKVPQTGMCLVYWTNSWKISVPAGPVGKWWGARKR